MEKDASAAYALEISAALAARRRGDHAASFLHLERAHVLGQRRTLKHVRAHWLMFSAGLDQKDFREVLGQIPRMVAALLFSHVWVPRGNTGRARVGAFTPMPVPEDLRPFVPSDEAPR